MKISQKYIPYYIGGYLSLLTGLFLPLSLPKQLTQATGENSKRKQEVLHTMKRGRRGDAGVVLRGRIIIYQAGRNNQEMAGALAWMLHSGQGVMICASWHLLR